MILKSILSFVFVIELVQGDRFEKIDTLFTLGYGDITINNDSDIVSNSVNINNGTLNVNKGVNSDKDEATEISELLIDLVEFLFLSEDDPPNLTIGGKYPMIICEELFLKIKIK